MNTIEKLEQQLGKLRSDNKLTDEDVKNLKTIICNFEYQQSLNKMKDSLKEFRWKRFGAMCIGILLFLVLGYMQFKLLSYDFGENMNVKIWIWAMVAFVFVVQLVVAYIQVLNVWKFNKVIKKLDLLKLKMELDSKGSSAEIEREIQLLMRVLDKKTI